MARLNQLSPRDIDIASEALYAAFVRYSGTNLEGCAHCVSFEESAVIRRAPLRRLGGELQRYLFKAMSTWGTEDDFKHFLPRLVELHASSSDAWLLCDKLAYARWRTWPKYEQEAVERYLRALWHYELAVCDPVLPGNILLETMVTLEIDLAPYDLRKGLERWRSEKSRESALSVARFVLEHGPTLFWSASPTGRCTFWRARPEIAHDVASWLVESATREYLEFAYIKDNDIEVAQAFDSLEMFARSW